MIGEGGRGDGKGWGSGRWEGGESVRRYSKNVFNGYFSLSKS
jgi:hypothetical protein